MRHRPGKPLAILGLGCVLVLLVNVQCGEFLLLHYLCCPDCNADRSAELDDQTPTGQQSPTPSTVIVQPAQQGCKAPIEITHAETLPGEHLPPPTACSKGDLNGDGKVDGLDIQVLVNCLLEQ